LLAEADVPVLILGEAGSGKDTVARLIHKLSVRSGFSFLKVNCADMPADLLEAELFGTERNPAVGNGRAAVGKLERAEKGTMYLDEIAEMPLTVQARLMQVLQDKALFKAGRDRGVPIDVRVIAATGANPDRLLAERKLREDLYYRLSAFTVQVPPLRQRKSEIAILLQHTMHQLSRHYGLPPREFSASMLDACQNYSWPGNLKELENFVKRYLVAGDSELALSDLESNLGRNQKTNRSGSAMRAATQIGAGLVEDHSNAKSLRSLINTIKSETERNAIGTALHKTGWNRKAAARLLQVSYRTLLYKIDQYQMSASESFLSPLPAGKLPLNGNSAKPTGKTS
jgi:two-component system, NtrC family, response regulator AtoC